MFLHTFENGFISDPISIFIYPISRTDKRCSTLTVNNRILAECAFYLLKDFLDCICIVNTSALI